MDHAPLTTAVFNDLIAALEEIRDDYVGSEDRFSTPLDVAEGYRYVAQALSAASELFVEGDPDHPRLASIASPARKMQGDNPDAIYHFSRIRGDRSYRIRGIIEDAVYTSFTIHGPAIDGGMAGPLLGDVNNQDFQVEADGSYSLVLSATPHEGNWLALDPGAHCVVVRTYYQLPLSVQCDPFRHVKIGIEILDDVPPPAPLSDAVLSERMAEAVRFVRQVTLGQTIFGTTVGIPFVAETPNTLPMPFSFRDSGLPVPGAADIVYAMGRWDLANSESLEMTGLLPSGVFANVMLWNHHMQTLEYCNRTSSLNQAQIKLESDGSFRIVVGAHDTGAPNWLDTEGHETGTIFWRFLLPDEAPGAITCKVMTTRS